jgi:molybdopterin synthase catalytic subunit
MIDVRVQSADFDPGRQMERLSELGQASVIARLKLVETAGDVERIVIEHYAGMAKAELGRIAEEASGRWPLAGIILIHRHGSLMPGDRLSFIGVAASDDGAAREAGAFLAEAVRGRAPFWRQERLAGGATRWAEGAAQESGSSTASTT